MNIREEIKELLDHPTGSQELQKLLSCFDTKFGESHTISRVKLETWLKGCIESLFYKPNRQCLILCGNEEENEKLLNYIMFEDLPYSCGGLITAESYQHKVFVHSVSNELEYYTKVKQIGSLCQSDGFVCTEGTFDSYPECDKRLASFCGVMSKWSFPKRKDMVVINIENIDWEAVREINFKLVWIELYLKYKL